MVLIQEATAECVNCQTPHEEETLIYDAGRLICEECVDAAYLTCCGCAVLVHEDDAFVVLRSSEAYCPDCRTRFRPHDPDRYAEDR